MDNTTYTPGRQEANILQAIAKHRAYNQRTAAVMQQAADAIKAYDPNTSADISYRAQRIIDCGSYVSIGTYNDGTAAISKANFCRLRQCSVCAWRRQARFVATTYPALEALSAQGYQMIWATLTQRNTTTNALIRAIDDMQAAYTRLMRISAIAATVIGYVRSLEITRNNDNGTWHPHIHAIWIVPRDYYTSNSYISHDDLVRYWQQALTAGYKPNVDIRQLRHRGTGTAYVEALKYALKPTDMHPQDYIQVTRALHRRRLICFGGVLKQLRALNLDTGAADYKSTDATLLREALWQINTATGLYELQRVIQQEIDGGGADEQRYNNICRQLNTTAAVLRPDTAGDGDRITGTIDHLQTMGARDSITGADQIQ